MKLEDQQTVESARELANMILRPKRAKSTVHGYINTFNRLHKANQTPAEYCRESSKGVYYAIKAGYQYGLANEINKQIEKWFGSKNSKELQSLPRILEKINELVAKLKDSDPDYNKENQHKGINKAFTPGRKKRSKRQALRYLPQDWREIIIGRVAPQHRRAIVVFAVCGCRPAELAKGVTIVKRKTEIEVIIQGAKLTKNAGQKERRLFLDPRLNPFAMMLWDELEPGQKIVVSANRWTISDAIKKAAKNSGIKKWKVVSPYCFRHQFAADTKSEGSQISEAMGHAADRTASNYGQKSQAKGRSGIRDVIVPRTVKRSINRGADQHIATGPRQ